MLILNLSYTNIVKNLLKLTKNLQLFLLNFLMLIFYVGVIFPILMNKTSSPLSNHDNRSISVTSNYSSTKYYWCTQNTKFYAIQLSLFLNNVIGLFSFDPCKVIALPKSAIAICCQSFSLFESRAKSFPLNFAILIESQLESNSYMRRNVDNNSEKIYKTDIKI